MIPNLNSNPEAMMAKNGKSFYFASVFFPPERMRQIARLYQVCRYIDDCADELEPSQSRLMIRQLRLELDNPQIESDFQSAVRELEFWGLRRWQLSELLAGAEFDLSQVRIRDQKQFLQYCYWVAGVVGLMMCPLLGAKNHEASSAATNLGIGMQITNICRDVLEDSQNGRIYFAQQILDQKNCDEIPTRKQKTPQELREVVRFYLELADEYYRQGYRGLSYLPFRSRLCIVVAGEVYRHIGVKLRSKAFDVLRGRVSLSLFEKLWVAVKCVRFLFYPHFWFKLGGRPSDHLRGDLA